MAELIDWITTELPAIDMRLRDRITCVASGPIPAQVRNAMTLGTMLIANQMEKDAIDFKTGLPITCVFTAKSEFGIRLDSSQVAIAVDLAVYSLEQMQPYLESVRLYSILVEELCHLIWEIKDEVEVKYKVLEIMQSIFPNLTIDDLYSSLS